MSWAWSRGNNKSLNGDIWSGWTTFLHTVAVCQQPDPRAASQVIVWRKGHLSVPNDVHHFPQQSTHSLQCHRNSQQLCCLQKTKEPTMQGWSESQPAEHVIVLHRTKSPTGVSVLWASCCAGAWNPWGAADVLKHKTEFVGLVDNCAESLH